MYSEKVMLKSHNLLTSKETTDHLPVKKKKKKQKSKTPVKKKKVPKSKKILNTDLQKRVD